MTRRRLITERDVARARREGATSIVAAGAIVTPSARDAAAKWGITLSGEPESTAHRRSLRLGPPTSARNATATPAAAPASARRSTSGAMDRTAPSTAAIGASAGAGTGDAWRVALGADHGGVAMKDALLAFLRERGVSVHDVGTFSTDAVDYPDYAVAVARAVASGTAALGIMVDGAGIGSCMTANKVAGVRAAMCYDVTTAANAREHNNANVLTLGGTLIGVRLAQEIVRTFLETPFGGGRHAPRVAKIDALDAARRGSP